MKGMTVVGRKRMTVLKSTIDWKGSRSRATKKRTPDISAIGRNGGQRSEVLAEKGRRGRIVVLL